jgi:hypothetical protein
MKSLFLFVSFIISTITVVSAQRRWSFDLNAGSAYNFPMPLNISQQGYPDIKLIAHYHTDAFSLPIYWDLRFSRWQNGKSWEFETIHHKLYLNNPTAEVQKFNISHGFNILTVNRGFIEKKFQLRAGGGIVLAHPESIIRGKAFGDSGDSSLTGYYISGPVINLAVSRPIHLGSRFYINAEAKSTLAYLYLNVAQGHANFFSLAFHIVLGLGFDFIELK